MRLLAFLITGLLLLSITDIQAQESVYRRYGTQKTLKKLKKENPELLENIAKQERQAWSAKYIPQEVTIPIVFHIVYADAKSNISREQVLSQLAALNRDFRNKSGRDKEVGKEVEEFARLAADTEIRFCLAAEDPKGKASSGINYYDISNTIWNNDDAIKAKKDGVPPWKTDDYLNIWIAPLDNRISGYAQKPGGPKDTDGIVIDYRFFGTLGTATAPYNEGKTLTHLIGNYLNLQDLWSENDYCADDGVADTPIHNSPNAGCPPYRQISLCSGNPIEMTMNFMDNTDDACMYMFTYGQKKRMQMALAKGGPRANLVKGKVQCHIDNLADSKKFSSSVAEHVAQGIHVNIFPNPTKGEFNVQSNQIISQISVFDLFGKLLHQINYPVESANQNIRLDSRAWTSGTYVIQVHTGQEFVNKKIVISK